MSRKTLFNLGREAAERVPWEKVAFKAWQIYEDTRKRSEAAKAGAARPRSTGEASLEDVLGELDRLEKENAEQAETSRRLAEQLAGLTDRVQRLGRWLTVALIALAVTLPVALAGLIVGAIALATG
ncbi:MAG: hypothetical protein ACOCTI_01605 [Phycisphaeraceae bacterium]